MVNDVVRHVWATDAGVRFLGDEVGPISHLNSAKSTVTQAEPLSLNSFKVELKGSSFRMKMEYAVVDNVIHLHAIPHSLV